MCAFADQDSENIPRSLGLKAWFLEGEYTDGFVVAESLERAIEILASATNGDAEDYSLQEIQGDWWNRLPPREGLWVEQLDADDKGTGDFYTPLSHQEGENILREKIQEILMQPTEVLLDRYHGTFSTKRSLDGTLYRVITTVTEQSGVLEITVMTDDFLYWDWGVYSRYIHRQQDIVRDGDDSGINDIDWINEGF